MLRRILFLFLVLSLAGCAAKSAIRTTHVNGVDIAYRESGSGAPLLMIMGYAGTMEAWDPVLIDRLDDRYRVIVFDNRNMGRSSTSSEMVSIDLMARDALGLLDALGIERAHVFGWSMGSIIGQEMALARPGAVDKLVLYGTALQSDVVMQAIGRFDGLTPEQFMAMLFPKAWVEQNQDIYARLPKPTVPATPEAIGRQRQALADWPGTTGELADIGQDVLLVVGEDDDITPPKQSLEAARQIPGAWLVRFKGAGHWLMHQAPEDLASIVHSFIEGRQDLLR